MYTEQTLVRIAKRENNPKRGYLVVNRLQGKHIPVSPSAAMEMFDVLADKVACAYGKERLLLVGFAETATAIGARLAVKLHTWYMQTTREEIDGVHYVYFTESHSHATEQKLVREDLDAVAEKVDRIVFVEDEITTGNTIFNIITILNRDYPGRFQFAAASLLNGMDCAAQAKYAAYGIDLQYLVKTDHDAYADRAAASRGDGKYYEKEIAPGRPVRTLSATGLLDARRCVAGKEYDMACERLWEQLREQITACAGQRFLTLGSEEFMYPALYVAWRMEALGISVQYHATTRSPIAVSAEPDYPLHARYELASLYDQKRRTFLYDLAQYDQVWILSDAQPGSPDGLCSLANALDRAGNRHIVFCRWQK